MKKILLPILFVTLTTCKNNSENEVQKIKDANKMYVQYYNSGNLEGLASLHTKDAVVMPPNIDFVVGSEMIKSALKNEIEMGSGDLIFSERDIFVSGKIAYDEGTYELKIKSPEGITIGEDYGKYIVIWEKQTNGDWLMKKDIWNSSIPLTKYNSEEIIFVVEMNTNNKSDEEIEEFSKFYQQMIDKTEANSLGWSFFKSGKNKVTLIERYANQKAMKVHGDNISPGGISENHFNSFMDHFTINLITVYGATTDKFKDYIKGFKLPVKFKPLISGYSRK